MQDEFIKCAKTIANIITQHNFARIISHDDADGLTSAGILAQALRRQNIQFHVTITSRLDEKIIELVNNSTEDGDIVIFCDMGSGQPKLIENIKQPVLIIDHHQITGKTPAKAMINPLLFGIDGATEICASGTTYLVAKAMNSNNIDLVGLAIVGLVGDKQLFKSANEYILNDAIQSNAISIKKGLKIGSGNIVDILSYSIEPYLDTTGNPQKTKEFLDSIDIHGHIEDLDEKQIKKLATSITLKLVENASLEAIDDLIGEIYILNKEVISDVYDFANILNAGGNIKNEGVALSLCLRDKSNVHEVQENYIKHRKTLVEDIKKFKNDIVNGKNIRYIIGKEMKSAGIIASTFIRYKCSDMPFIALSETEDIVKIASRGTRVLVKNGLDLSSAVRIGAEKCGGHGGGHTIAAGAAIPKEKKEEFINIVDDIIGTQLQNKTSSKSI
ncbi:MAG: DHH family phosphoesterase [Methanosarcinaceae archaeon]|jgi:single-stranded DNA-specific DHH superfamily exonuclease|nr:DHH family phosphoesterase [Methanosarcinaceae archaeon]NKQ39811.1 DHH family phosphoesterase [Methanosarcinales archaeon]